MIYTLQFDVSLSRMSIPCSLQKFKLNIANTVITQENTSLLSMNTSQLLDLFQLSTDTGSGDMPPGGTGGGVAGPRPGVKREGMRSILDTLPELWSEEQYSSEYDLTTFMQSLAATKK